MKKTWHKLDTIQSVLNRNGKREYQSWYNKTFCGAACSVTSSSLVH